MLRNSKHDPIKEQYQQLSFKLYVYNYYGIREITGHCGCYNSMFGTVGGADAQEMGILAGGRLISCWWYGSLHALELQRWRKDLLGR